MQILFVHGNYPAQFGWIAKALARTSQHEVRFLTARQEAAWQAQQFPEPLRQKLTVIFDGVDAGLCQPPATPPLP